MKRDKYMGMDVHQATTVVVVIDAEGTTQAEWLYDIDLQANQKIGIAERGGFEPPVQLLTVQRFSKPPPSATRPPLRVDRSRARWAAQVFYYRRIVTSEQQH